MYGGTLPPPPPPPQRASNGAPGPPWRLIGLGGAGGLALGSVLPWASVQSVFGSITVNGTDGDGVLTLACGIIAIIGFAVRKPLLALIPSAIGLAIGLFDLIDINRNIGEVETDFARASIGYGLWLLVAGGVVAVVAAALLITQRRLRKKYAEARRAQAPATGR